MRKQFAGVILAAGRSQRLGYPKQFVCYQGETLLTRTIQASESALLSPIIVVVNPDHQQQIDDLQKNFPQIIFRYNPQNDCLMSESLANGVSQCLSYDLQGIMLMVCDQPYLSANTLIQMTKAAQDHPEKIISCRYSNSFGVPSLFPKQYAQKLMSLAKDQGAKKLLYQHQSSIVWVDFAQGHFDIDTPQEHQQLLDKNRNNKKE
jgi:molybdenum cofactor cytidylyltransferase